MTGLVRRNVERVDRSVIARCRSAGVGVASVHEAMNRSGLLAPRIRPIQSDVRIAGAAVTVSVPPGDNWMIHVAAELCRTDDILVVAPTSRCDVGYFGDVLAAALLARGVAGLVIDAGVRDVTALRAMKFPVWSSAISAQGTIKETLGEVNAPLVCAGALVHPGDLVIADDDGVVVVPRAKAEETLAAAADREAKEDAVRLRIAAGESTLDIYNMRAPLKAKGLRDTD